jgi:hypothetical protein
MTATPRQIPFVAAMIAILTTFLGGCGPAANTKVTTTTGGKQAEDPWPKLAVALRGNTDAAACRQLLSELNSGLALNTAADRPVATVEAVNKVAAALNLGDAEKKLLAQTEYSSLDGWHLAESLYLRDVAKSLGVIAADPPVEKAAVAFRWVCRQVALNPWLVREADGVRPQPPVPPTFVLRRGSGSGLERAFVFASLCRHLDLDAYLVGRSAADKGWNHQPAGEGTGAPKGPFWAVGVRDGQDVLLFDPWRGEPLPGKTVGRPGTLAEAKSDPKFAAAWRDDKATPWKVDAADVTGAELYLSAPLSALAPRTALLEQKLTAELAVKLAVGWDEWMKRAEAAAGGAAVKGWNPATDGYTPVRVTGTFLPTDLGGLDPTPQGSVYSGYRFSLLPREALTVALPGLNYPEVTNRLRLEVVARMDSTFQDLQIPVAGGPADGGTAKPTPLLERIQRGRYNETTKELVELRNKFRAGETAVASAVGAAEAVSKWVELANQRYEALSRARVAADRAAKVVEAERDIAEFWKTTGDKQALLVASMVSRPAAAEATYLLALSFHERAERAEAEANRGQQANAAAGRKATDEWAKAVEWWGKYDEYRDGQEVSFPGRAAHTKALAARATERATGRKAGEAAR